MKGTAQKKKKKSAFLSGNKHQPLSDMEPSCAKNKSKAQLLDTECAQIFLSVTFPKEKTKGRKSQNEMLQWLPPRREQTLEVTFSLKEKRSLSVALEHNRNRLEPGSIKPLF